MIWIEMSKDEAHGGGEWAFSKCVWAPTYKKSQNRALTWPFWENVRDVRSGDTVLHLRWTDHRPAFVGLSTADTDGHITAERPPNAGVWDYCDTFYRALLTDYSEFSSKIELDSLFSKKGPQFREYYQNHNTKPKNLFYVVQSGRLQCLNGAYLSPADSELAELILGESISANQGYVREKVSTSEVWRRTKQRNGQSQFAESVKANYHYQCCFPDCPVNDRNFLIGSHIARWVDNPERRGQTANGLCFCPLHDKAFELGYFSLDDEYRVIISKDAAQGRSGVFRQYIEPYGGRQIKSGNISPDNEALNEHRCRCYIKSTFDNS